jgi:hypothetical protein
MSGIKLFRIDGGAVEEKTFAGAVDPSKWIETKPMSINGPRQARS